MFLLDMLPFLLLLFQLLTDLSLLAPAPTPAPALPQAPVFSPANAHVSANDVALDLFSAPALSLLLTFSAPDLLVTGLAGAGAVSGPALSQVSKVIGGLRLLSPESELQAFHGSRTRDPLHSTGHCTGCFRPQWADHI